MKRTSIYPIVFTEYYRYLIFSPGRKAGRQGVCLAPFVPGTAGGWSLSSRAAVNGGARRARCRDLVDGDAVFADFLAKGLSVDAQLPGRTAPVAVALSKDADDFVFLQFGKGSSGRGGTTKSTRGNISPGYKSNLATMRRGLSHNAAS